MVRCRVSGKTNAKGSVICMDSSIHIRDLRYWSPVFLQGNQGFQPLQIETRRIGALYFCRVTKVEW